jgi:hypothetical protein
MAQQNTISFDASSLQVRSVVDTFKLVRPREYPFLKWASGGSDDAPALNNLSKTPTSTKYEWGDKDDFPRKTKLAADIDNSSGSLSVTVADAPFMIIGFVIQVDEEVMLVTAKGNSSTGVVGVTRGWAGTSAAAHATDAVAEVVDMVHAEGGDSTDDHYTSANLFYNYFKEMSREINISDMRMGVEVIGADDVLEEESAQKMRGVFEIFEKSSWRGLRVDPAANAGKGQFGGVLTFTDPDLVFDAGGSALTKEMMRNLWKKSVDQIGVNGAPDTLFVGSWGKIKVNELYKSEPILYADAFQRTGGVVIDTIINDFGVATDVVLDPWMPENWVAALKSDTVKIGPLPQNEFRRKHLGTSGSGERFELVGAYTEEWQGRYTRWVIKNISTTV